MRPRGAVLGRHHGPQLKEPVGSLYRIDPDFAVHRMASGIVCSNGIAFEPGRSHLLSHRCTGAARIDAYDFDLASGAISNRRVHAEFGVGQGTTRWLHHRCRGLSLGRGDHGRDGGAHRSSRPHRSKPSHSPTRRPTSAMFGGRDLRTLFITSMQHGLTPEQLASDPQAGCLFAVDLNIPGLPEPTLRGLIGTRRLAMADRIGFVGTGAMGSGMALCPAKGGRLPARGVRSQFCGSCAIA